MNVFYNEVKKRSYRSICWCTRRDKKKYDLKYQIQELMISEESKADEIEEWSDEL